VEASSTAWLHMSWFGIVILTYSFRRLISQYELIDPLQGTQLAALRPRAIATFTFFSDSKMVTLFLWSEIVLSP
jgi:hypothetical protein